MKKKILPYFEIEKLNTTVKREVLARFTTLISMAYILFVNPTVLGAPGTDEGAVFTMIALASAIGCALTGVLARYLIGTAPALRINAFFAYSVCLGTGVPWETVLADVFVTSLTPILITIFKPWEMIINATPADLKYAISGGISLLIAFLGLDEGGITVSNESTLVGLELLNIDSTWLTIFGSVVTAILLVRRIPGGIFIGMATTTTLGLVIGLTPMFSEIVAAAPSSKLTFLVALKHVGDVNSLQMQVVVLTFLLVTFFDTAETLVRLANRAGFMKDNKMSRVGRVLASDSTAMFAGSLLGTSPTDAFVESPVGIVVGGRSGTTAITTGIFSLSGLFPPPLPSVVTSQITALALIMVGVLMAQSLQQIEWGNLEIVIPSFLILIGMPLICNISDGIALGFIFYPITMLVAKRGEEVSPIMYGPFFVFVGFVWISNVK